MTSTAARLALAAVLLATSAGCAFGNRTARLAWPPPGQPLAPAPGATAPAVAVVPVVDRRPEPRRQVGTVRNGYYMHTADVETDADLAAWAGAALVDELHRAGVQVVAPAAGVPEVGAELQRVASDAYFVYSGEVDLRAWLRRGGAVAYDAQLHGEGSAGMNWAATGESYTETLTEALGAAARAAARGIAAALLRPAAATASPPLAVAPPTTPDATPPPLVAVPAEGLRPPRPFAFYLATSYDFGFTELVRVDFADGTSRRMRSNGGVLLAAGASFLDLQEGRLSTRATAGIKYDAINAGNGSVRALTFPLELVEQASVGPVRLAGGLSLALGSRLTGSGAASGLGVRFDPSLGVLLEARWVFGPGHDRGRGFGIGPRLLWQRLRESTTGQSIDASAVGLAFDATL